VNATTPRSPRPAARLVTEPCDQVTVTFTRAQADALFGLLRQATRCSYGLLITADVRDAWCELSAAWARASPGRADSDDITERT
jgi:hypothetical protein